MSGWVAGAMIVGTIVKVASTHGDRKRVRSEEKKFDEMRETYEQTEFEPLDRDALRRENIFEGQENIMEDMEIDTQAADYAKEQFQQQQANIMQGLRGVAGTSGAAGLAQTLSGQASKQARESQITIGGQLQQARKMRLQEQARLNQQERAEESRLSQQDRAIQLANMEGARQFDLDKMSTMMGVQGQKIAGLQGEIAAKQAMWGDIIGGVAGIGAAFATGGLSTMLTPAPTPKF